MAKQQTAGVAVEASTTHDLTRRDIERQVAALGLMGRAFLPSMNSDLKVGALLRLVGPVAEPFQGEREKEAARIIESVGGPLALDSMKGTAQEAVAMKIRAAHTSYNVGKVKLSVPNRLLLTQDDLPKEKTGDDGWKNAAQRGAIIADLGVLFVMPKD